MAPSGKMQARILEGVIWSVRIDADAGTLGLQLRDSHERVATYHWMDLNDGSLGPRIDLADGWWTDLIAVAGGHLRIGCYGDPALPVISNEVYIDGRQALLLPNGDTWTFQNQPAPQVPSPSERLNEPAALPLLPGTYCHVLHHGDGRILAWHTQLADGPALFLELQHPDHGFRPICLESKMEKLNPSPFFVAGEWLIAIRNRNEILWMRLGKP